MLALAHPPIAKIAIGKPSFWQLHIASPKGIVQTNPASVAMRDAQWPRPGAQSAFIPAATNSDASPAICVTQEPRGWHVDWRRFTPATAPHPGAGKKLLSKERLRAILQCDVL